MQKENPLQHISLMVVNTSSISRPGISMTPSHISNNSRIQWDLVSKSVPGISRQADFYAHCVVPTKSTRGTVTHQFSDKNYRGIIWTNKRLYNFWHAGEMLTGKGLSVDQQRQKICMRCVQACSVRRTDLFHSVFIWRAYLLARFLVWHPYHEQQYVCSNWPLTLPDTADILQLSLLICDIKTFF